VQVSRSGSSAGSSFRLLRCKKCATTVGRVYVATASATIDPLRNLFTFESAKISCYELGKPALVADTAAGENCDKNLHPAAPGGVAGGIGDGSDASKVAELEVELRKVQNILLVMDERLANLEGSGGVEGGGGGAEGGGGSGGGGGGGSGPKRRRK